MITDPLSKRKAGTPLSEAEHEQRVNAARSRWSGLAVTGVGAAAGGGAAMAALGYAGRRQQAAIEAAHAPVRAAEAATDAALHIISHDEATVSRSLGPQRRSFNAAAIQALEAQAARADVQRDRILSALDPERSQFNYDTNRIEPTLTTHQADSVRGYEQSSARDRAAAEDIRANGKPPTRVEVRQGRDHLVDPFERPVQAKVVVWEKGAQERLDGLRQRFGIIDAPAAPINLGGGSLQRLPDETRLRFGLDDASRAKAAAPKRGTSAAKNRKIIDMMGGLRDGHKNPSLPQPSEALRVYLPLSTLDDLEAAVRHMPDQARGEFLERYGLPNFRYGKSKAVRLTPVAGGPRKGAKQHTRRLDGYPSAEARKHLSDELRSGIAQRAADMRAAEIKHAAWRDIVTKLQARRAAWPHVQNLNFIQHPGTRLAAIGAAAIAGGVGAHLLAQHVWGRRELGKSADGQPDNPDYFDQATGVEEQLAQNLAGALGNWKDGATDGAGASAKMAADLNRALMPLGEAIQAGASAPLTLTGGSNGSRALAFTLGARSPAPADFVDAYRLDRVRELQQGQTDAIKGVLQAAARDGASPAEMARRIRQTIGLTSNQAAQVLTYRKQLEQLDPGALQRSLRDKRFDPSVSAAIDQGTPLPAGKIDQVVDAYHRRYLALRATTIARTEALRAANNGHAAAVDQLINDNPSMTVVKTWVATHDHKTRDSHRKLDGQSVVGMDTPFIADDGSELLWPHDPNAPANQVINCRCTFVTHLIPTQVQPEQPDQETEDA